MGDVEHTAIAAAYRLAEPSTTGALLERLRAGTAELLEHGQVVPRRLTDAVIASGDRGLQIALANAYYGAPGMRAAHLRLARLGDPEVGRALYKASRWADCSHEVRAAVLTAADPSDPAWRAPGGLVPQLFDPSGRNSLAPALRAPFPELVTLALRVHGEALPPAMVRASCRAVFDHGGRLELAALADLIEEWQELGHPGLAALLRRALAAPDPAALLSAELSVTDQVICAVRNRTGRAPDLTVRPDWDQVWTEHRRRPFSPDEIMAFNRFPDCPPELAVEGFHADPGGTMARGTGPLPPSVLVESDLPLDMPGYRLRQALRAGIEAHWLPVDWMLREVRPAEVALQCLPRVASADDATRTAVARLLAPLGADPAAWISLYRQVNKFEGSAEALVAAACAAPKGRKTPSWPRALGSAFPSHEPEGARWIFQILFGYAEPEVQEALLPYLDGRTVQQLLVFGDCPPRLRERITAVHGRSAQIAHASHRSLSAEQLAELLDLDDPEVNAKLYRHCAIDREERVRILAGRGRRGAAVPVHPALLADLVEVKATHRRHWLTAGHLSGDPQVLRATLTRCQLHTEAGRLRAVIRLWERHGPQEVQAFVDEQEFPGRVVERHPLSGGTRRTVLKALAGPDGLAVLRARLTAEEDPDRVVAMLRKRAASTVTDQVRYLAAEGTALPWPELTRAHEAEPLAPELLAGLAAQPDCPYVLMLAALRVQRLWSHSTGLEWLPAALDSGRLTTADVLREAFPAPAVLEYLAAHDAHRRREVTRWRPPVREARQLVREHLGDDPEAWSVALQLLPDFTGSLPELLATAEAIVG
ncbi:hypothetical protein P3T37_007312 [Kitasatospora sp. MAA4]|uniref:hypothetical protein n=1 Tax=Kitasatospora sp. MAA4 TaxID=3035093 RepID=UPI002473B71F|nr:hypothetical protein [Kitasatospora sp. MAA4]MDH6137877.1 hypothetical protein [Kitasatospora sp. MAA4]